MFTIETTDFQRLAVSAIGALFLSTACVAVAVSPAQAQANAPLTMDDWQANVEQQIDTHLRMPARALDRYDQAAAMVRVRFDTNGGFTGAQIAESSGVRAVDREAIRVANRIVYPALPVGLRGRPQTVGMIVYMGNATSAVDEARHVDTLKALASGRAKKDNDTQTAALPSG